MGNSNKIMRVYLLAMCALAVAGSAIQGTKMTPNQERFNHLCVGGETSEHVAALKEWASELNIHALSHESGLEMCEKVHIALRLGNEEAQSNRFRFKRCTAEGGKGSFKPLDPKIC